MNGNTEDEDDDFVEQEDNEIENLPKMKFFENIDLQL